MAKTGANVSRQVQQMQQQNTDLNAKVAKLEQAKKHRRFGIFFFGFGISRCFRVPKLLDALFLGGEQTK